MYLSNRFHLNECICTIQCTYSTIVGPKKSRIMKQAIFLVFGIQTVASAAGGSNGSKSLICIWDVLSGTCRNTISYHRGAVQSLAFSRDDCFFLSAGQ